MSGSAGRPLRVNFFVNFVHPQGTYFRFHNLAVGLTRLGHAVTVYAADLDPAARPRSEQRDGVPYRIMVESRGAAVFGHACSPQLAVRRLARAYPRCDVAHLFQPFPGAAAAWLRAAARVKVYDWDDQWADGLMAGPPRSWRERWPRSAVRLCEGRLPARADHVTAISRYLADLALARGARGVTLLNSGSWPAAGVDRAAARRRLGLRPDAVYAGFMGRTIAELPWCFDALADNLARHPRLRLAVCGSPPDVLAGLPPAVRDRTDHLGQLAPAAARDFAGCLALALLPLADDTFNRSRLPQKFGDHLATGVPLLASTVGECGRLIGHFPWALPAGTTRGEWLAAFAGAIERVIAGTVPPFDPAAFHDHLSWETLGRRLADTYMAVLAGRTPAAAA